MLGCCGRCVAELLKDTAIFVGGRRAEHLAKSLETLVAAQSFTRQLTGSITACSRRTALLGAGLLVLSGAIAGARADEQHFITIGTGGVTGVYYPSGGATCKIVNMTRADHGVRCSVETTLGSIANIEKIRSGEIDFGYVQSDWQHHAFSGALPLKRPGRSTNFAPSFHFMPKSQRSSFEKNLPIGSSTI